MSTPRSNHTPRAWSDAPPTHQFPAPGRGYGTEQRSTSGAEPWTGEDPGRRERESAPLSELFRLSALWTELPIVAIVVGCVYAMIVWVIDLLTTRLSSGVGGDYLAIADPVAFAVRGAIFAVVFLAAGAVMMGLHRAVNAPETVFGWLFLVVALWAVIVLLTNPLWQAVPEMVLLVIAAGLIAVIVPPRVAAYRTAAPRLQ